MRRWTWRCAAACGAPNSWSWPWTMFAGVLPSRSSLKAPQPLGLSASPLRLRFLLPSCISVPVHPHLGNLPILGLTKNRPARVHLFPCPTASECAAKLRRKPWSRRVNLARRKIRFGLIQRDILPVRPDGGHPTIRVAEWRLQKDGVVRENRADGLDVPPLPALAECVDQDSKGLIHGAPI